MAPEQAMGERDVDAQADVWGFCIVLYELITGLVPFSGANVGHTIAAIIQLDPRSTTDLMGGDPELWAILKRGLEKAREDRWPGMAALRAALTAWAVAHGVSADITGAPLSVSPRSVRAPAPLRTPLIPGPAPADEEVEPTMFEATIQGPVLVVDPRRDHVRDDDHDPAPIVATPARRANVTATPIAARRSRTLVVIAILAIAVLAATVARRALHAAPADGQAIPSGAVAP
jgi:serine/threonine protein kinase